MIKTYETLCFENEPDWSRVPTGKIDCFQWEKPGFSRPDSSFQMCFVKNKGILVKMRSNEKNLRITCSGRDESVWEDSCLEFFFSPEKGAGYLNTEMNPRGAFLTQVGQEREHRKFLKELTDVSPQVSGFADEHGWGIELFLPCLLFKKAFGVGFCASPGVYKGNFYKCGDKTAAPHYGSFSPMRKELTFGFHDPEYFATIIVKEDVIQND